MVQALEAQTTKPGTPSARQAKEIAKNLLEEVVERSINGDKYAAELFALAVKKMRPMGSVRAEPI